MTRPRPLCLSAALLLLAGCASVPTSPDVLVLPGTGRTLEQFHGDDAACRPFARAEAAGSGQEAATGAGSSARTPQERYDMAYIQCMYAKGHRVPVPGHMLYEDRYSPYPPPPPASGGSGAPPAPPAGSMP